MPHRDRLILLSFDLEEFDIPEEYGQPVEPAVQFQMACNGLESVLALLDRLGITATFFTTANFALHHPALMQRIAQTHEIASHGFYHSSFEVADLTKSRQVLQEITGQSIAGYRMARLQPVDDREIQAAGYRYNSSMNPTWIPGRYNHLQQPRRPFYRGQLLNIPVSVVPRLRLPLFWLSFKNFPLWFYQWASRLTLAIDGHLNLYFHPWEFTSLRGYHLPAYIKRRSGQAMVDRLEAYLKWMGRSGRFATFSELCDCVDRRQVRLAQESDPLPLGEVLG